MALCGLVADGKAAWAAQPAPSPHHPSLKPAASYENRQKPYHPHQTTHWKERYKVLCGWPWKAPRPTRTVIA